MAITAATVKELRDRSGAGMMDCKKALAQTDGDVEAAVDWLRTQGLAAAQKKSSRTAAEGLVGVAVEGTKGTALEVNSETDFVAKNEQFQDFVRNATELALKHGANDVETIKDADYPGGGTLTEKLTGNIATIGENQTLRRAKTIEVSKGKVVSYVHNAAAPNLGKIGVLVALESEAGDDVLEPLGKQLAMHIAAAFPLALNADGLDQDTMEREAGRERQACRHRREDGAGLDEEVREGKCASEPGVRDRQQDADRGRGGAGRQGRRHQDHADRLCSIPAR